MTYKKLKATSISVGNWYLDMTDLTLKHADLGDYWVDAEKMNEYRLLDWIKHLSGKSGLIVPQDLRDFVKLAKLVQFVDVKKLRQAQRLPANASVTKALEEGCKHMTVAWQHHRKVQRLMKERGLGPAISVLDLGDLYDEVKAQEAETAKSKTRKAA